MVAMSMYMKMADSEHILYDFVGISKKHENTFLVGTFSSVAYEKTFCYEHYGLSGALSFSAWSSR